jgi:sugar (pentulose or hexulose) kinase
MGIEIERIIMTGGTSYNDAWNQIRADVLGREIRTIKNKEVCCLGAAILAGLATGVYKTAQEACSSIVKYDKVFSPSDKNHVIYNQIFNNYKKLYDSLKPIFAQTASK